MYSFLRSGRFQPASLQRATQNLRTFSIPKHHPIRATVAKPSYEILLSAYQRQIKEEDRFCLSKLEKEWSKTQPFKNKVVLVNVHMTLITLTMIRILLNAGAVVETTTSPDLVRHEDTMKALEESKIPFLDEIPEHKKAGYYDIIYDCGAGMRTITPKIGMAELTHTNPEIYNDLNFPVITVDTSKTKEIETGFGTGDSLVRVINDFSRKSTAAIVMHFAHKLGRLAQASFKREYDVNKVYLSAFLGTVSSTEIFCQNKFMIFGYGKVGKGIASALVSAGTPKKNISIVEVSTETFISVMEDGYHGILNNSTESDEGRRKIKEKIPEMWAIITATGVESAISKDLMQSDFGETQVLINMGTADEFGVNFAAERVLNNKKPANFMLDYPTEVIYLDPIFAIFLMAGEQLLVDPKLFNGLNPVSKKLDKAVLADWAKRHGENIWRHKTGQKETEKLLHALRENSFFSLGELRNLFDHYGIFNKPKALTPLVCLSKNIQQNSPRN